jgi:AcrR family transcriptional regulator
VTVTSSEIRSFRNGFRATAAGVVRRKRAPCPENLDVRRRIASKRQHGIFLAVAPLIERYGARRLTMRQAARSAHLSLGGLYHYFPTKRDLVLHALKPEALDRVCAEFTAWYGHLERTDPLRYLEADVDYMARQCFFIRPAFQAALELGAEDAWQHIEAGIDGRLRSCARPLRQALPGCTDDEIRSLGRSLRRTFFSALIDRTVTPEEMRDQMLSLIRGWTGLVQKPSRLEHPNGTALATRMGVAERPRHAGLIQRSAGGEDPRR